MLLSVDEKDETQISSQLQYKRNLHKIIQVPLFTAYMCYYLSVVIPLRKVFVYSQPSVTMSNSPRCKHQS